MPLEEEVAQPVARYQIHPPRPVEHADAVAAAPVAHGLRGGAGRVGRFGYGHQGVGAGPGGQLGGQVGDEPLQDRHVIDLRPGAAAEHVGEEVEDARGEIGGRSAAAGSGCLAAVRVTPRPVG